MNIIERNKVILYETILLLYPKLSLRQAVDLVLHLTPSNIQLLLQRNKFWLAYLFSLNDNTEFNLITSSPKENFELYVISAELIKAIQKMNLLVNRSKYP